MAVCQYHGDRPGIGICMRCRAVICAACCTRVDGVNHCHACLKVLGRRDERPAAAVSLATVGAVLFVSVGWLATFLLSRLVGGWLAP